ncbi:MAG: thiolase family protein [Candidatus Marinimicrobia bacterium]|jgi:acetyl-CoA C-acetyltransferase|nr:thiolase family protein [Candidatus Neomarinimicrobiota bacterium]HJM47277.1 thiolase family protein [Candidatus Neomarinimicrobiota bacterium]|tara:strand:+ start:16783 stop:17967 length:1185 start_codon:yes stop_codon:yes gene_type:complete
MKNEVLIIDGKRTPVGSFNGGLSTINAPELGAVVIKELVNNSQIDPYQIDEVIMGNVLSAGLGQAPARQAALRAGLPYSTECLTINKMCGSGLKATMLAMQSIQIGDAKIVIAGGMENMSLSPYLLPKARSGYRLGHGEIIDSMITDGLWDAYHDKHMGSCAEMLVEKNNISRVEQDQFAEQSYTKAHTAIKSGWFSDEIVSVSVPQRKGVPIIVDQDEEPQRINFEKMKVLRPAFEKSGTITAANASKINDGAAAVLITSSEFAHSNQLKSQAKMIAQASFAHEPDWFTTAPIKAISKVLSIAGLNEKDIDLWEINEAFAPVAMAAIDEYNIDGDKVNICGGAIALGHPIGASGARILVTLLHSLKRVGGRFGLATLCIGGGEASALIIEIMS